MVEGFGRVIIEGACSGTPTLVHDDNWFCELIRDQHFRVDMSKPESLANRLAYSLSNEAEERTRFQPIQERVISEFNWSKLVPAYIEELYL